MSKSIKEITDIIKSYPLAWRRWCNGPEEGGCACMGCIRVPAPSTVPGDPEYFDFPDPQNKITKEEASRYFKEIKE